MTTTTARRESVASAAIEVLRLSDGAWRVRDMTGAAGGVCPILAFIDRNGEGMRLTWLDRPRETEWFDGFTAAVAAVEAAVAQRGIEAHAELVEPSAPRSR